MTFIEELRSAHAVFTAYRMGARSIPEVARRTGLAVTECNQWMQLLRLPYESEEDPSPRKERRNPFSGLTFDI